MKRRRWIILAALLVAGAAAAAGAIGAIGRSSDNTSTPSGRESILRIQPAKEKVSCGEPAPVFVYLDDLADRPSPRDENVSYGVASFEFLLRYDPKVVRIAQPIDAELNPELDREDDDGDGLARSFLPVANIDDGAGRALFGPNSYVPTGRTQEDNLEEGLDPVAKGEPILLMTIRLTPVGPGDAGLTIRHEDIPGPLYADPSLFDPSGKAYEPLVVVETDITVEGGDCPSGPFATPRPTPKPRETPTVPPTPTLPVWGTVQPTEATHVGREDCPSDWIAYVDGLQRFSICYPAEYNATASDFAVNIHKLPPPGQRGGGFTVAVSWAAFSNYAVMGPPSPEACAKYAVMGQVSSRVVERAVNGKQVTACLNQGILEGSEGLSIVTLKGEIPVAKDESARDGFITFYIGHVDSSANQVPALAEAVLGTLEVIRR